MGEVIAEGERERVRVREVGMVGDRGWHFRKEGQLMSLSESFWKLWTNDLQL